MQRKRIAMGCVLALAAALSAIPAAAAVAPGLTAETQAQRDVRMQWWRDARFGMFIHWGLYAVPAGQWKEKEVPSIGEWIMNNANIPVAEYEALARQFNPVKYDPAAWVRTAKRAGIQYLVITSKHHDGFCLFDSAATGYTAAKAAAIHKDLLRPLAAECRKQGIKFCVYYSIMDWHHPAQYRGDDKHYNPTRMHPERKAEYVAYMKAQLKELIDSYDPGILWFDGEWPDWWTEPDGRDLYAYLRGLKPALIVNNRVGKGRKGMEGLNKGDQRYVGDYGTPEQQIPAKGVPGVDWESCMTMNDTWGFKRSDHHWKSARTLIRNLIDSASKGGNYVINVGPTAEGEIPAASIERLHAMGDWMAPNGESIYGTQANPLEATPWGRATLKSTAGGNTRLYLHVFDWPQDAKLVVPHIGNRVLAARLLEGAMRLTVAKEGHKVVIDLPTQAPDAIATVVALDLAGPLQIVKIDPYAEETPAERDARMHWWREARFGMFVHWGVYSVPAGAYHGQQVKGIGEWIMNRGRIPMAEYQAFAKRFNPVKFDAERWVEIAKNAGMKYIVITSKHHDGFAMFHSRASAWNIYDATPFHRDPLQELSAACRRQGLRLGFYYSQAQDWNHPGGAAAGGHWDKAQDGDMDAYLRDVAVPQVREILSNYGKIAVLWWDTPKDMTRERAEMLLPLLKLQPGIIHNNRLGGGYRGDTETPEQYVPPTGYPGRDWETCMTMNDTWGYKSYDQNWKSVETLIDNLVDIASKGGNYLLNVGPTSEGEIPQPSVERLQEIGRWMKANGESIYATTASPFKRLPWGRATKKLHPGGATLYLHVFQWPADGQLLVPGLKNEVSGAWLLVDPAKNALATERRGDDLIVSLPAAAPDAVCSVVVLEVKGDLDVEPLLPTQAADGSMHLAAADAVCHGEVKYKSGHHRDDLGFWLNPADWVEWPFVVSRPGSYTVTAAIAAPSSASFIISAGESRLVAQSPVTGDYARFKTVTLGKITLAKPGKVSLAVRAVPAGWRAFNLRSIDLKPAK
jgi:alpha-L-fucosidase